MFLSDQAENLKIRQNLVLYARLYVDNIKENFASSTRTAEDRTRLKEDLKPAFAAMHGLHSMVRIGPSLTMPISIPFTPLFSSSCSWARLCGPCIAAIDGD